MLWAPEEAGIGPFGSGGEGNSLTPDPSAPSGPRSYSPAGWPYLLKGRGGREHAVLSQPLPVTAAPLAGPGGSSVVPKLARLDPGSWQSFSRPAEGL